jgi:hypothetical protein
MCEDKRYLIPEELKPFILALFKEKGIKYDDMINEGYIFENEYDILDTDLELAIESDPAASSKSDSGDYAIRYRYNGPRDDKNRNFCANVLDLNLIFRKEDIDMMSFRTENKDFGTYSIFKYKGSYNCRHNWKRLVFKKATKNAGTVVPGYKEISYSKLPEKNKPGNDNQAREVNKKVKLSIEHNEDEIVNSLVNIIKEYKVK